MTKKKKKKKKKGKKEEEKEMKLEWKERLENVHISTGFCSAFFFFPSKQIPKFTVY